MKVQVPTGASYLGRVKGKLRRTSYDLLKIDSIRYWFCYARWALWKNKLKISRSYSHAVSQGVIDYNLTAFDQPRAAFGMAKRMAVLLFPTAALLREIPAPRVLIVGPRTEDDIFWAQSLGLVNTTGLDLFSYSRFIDVGDMHQMPYDAGTFDAVLFGWVLAYSKEPAAAVREGKRLLKPGGLLGIGMQSVSAEAVRSSPSERYNSINDASDLIQLVGEKVVFVHDPPVGEHPRNREIGVVFQTKPELAD